MPEDFPTTEFDPIRVADIEADPPAQTSQADNPTEPGLASLLTNPPHRERVLSLLKTALAAELSCVVRYKRHHYLYMLLATDARPHRDAAKYLEHAAEEQQHADCIAERILQLGGVPNLEPEFGAQLPGHFADSDSPSDVIREDIAAECAVIDGYAEIIRCIGNHDPTTCRMIEEILAAEQKHADELSRLLRDQSI